MLQYYDFTLAVNGVQQVQVPGRYIAYYAGQSDAANTATQNRIAVKLGPTGNEVILQPGQAVHLGDSDKDVPFWSVRNYDNTNNVTGQLLVGDGQFYDANKTVTIGASNVSNAAALPVKRQQLSTITTFVPVVINTGAAQALVSDSTQMVLRIRNTHATANLYIGGSTVTTANAAKCIPAGGMWIEDEAAGAAWYATSDTNGVSVAIEGLKL